MSSGMPKAVKASKKKLTLSRETLKDLRAQQGSDKLKGGAAKTMDGQNCSF